MAFSSFLEEIFKNKKPLPHEKLNVIVNLTEKGIRAWKPWHRLVVLVLHCAIVLFTLKKCDRKHTKHTVLINSWKHQFHNCCSSLQSAVSAKHGSVPLKLEEEKKVTKKAFASLFFLPLLISWITAKFVCDFQNGNRLRAHEGAWKQKKWEVRQMCWFYCQISPYLWERLQCLNRFVIGLIDGKLIRFSFGFCHLSSLMFGSSV